MKTKTLNRFFKRCCLLAENARYPALELYLSYVNWCINHGAVVVDQFTFLDMVESQGFTYTRLPGQSWFQGICVLPNYRIE